MPAGQRLPKQRLAIFASVSEPIIVWILFFLNRFPALLSPLRMHNVAFITRLGMEKSGKSAYSECAQTVWKKGAR